MKCSYHKIIFIKKEDRRKKEKKYVFYLNLYNENNFYDVISAGI